MRSLLPRLPKFAAAHPKLHVELHLGDRSHDILSEGVDIAFRMGAPIPLNAVARKVGKNQRLLAAAPSYLAQAGLPKSPDDLSAHALIIGPAGRSAEGWTFRKAAQTHMLEVKGRYLLDSTDAATSAAVHGLGIVSTGNFACLNELQQGSLIQVIPDWKMEAVDVHLVLADGRMSKPSARVFADFIAQDFKRHPLGELAECPGEEGET